MSTTWSSLVAIEPRLGILAKDVQSTEPDFDGYWQTWSQHKQSITALVGDNACQHELRTSEAYDVAYQTLYAAYETRWGFLS